MRQITLASFDQAIHTRATADAAAVLAALSDELMQVPTTPGTNMGATFGHMAAHMESKPSGSAMSAIAISWA